MRNEFARRLSGIAVMAALVALCLGSNAALAAEPTPAADNSLTTAEYVQAGLPAIDKPWTAKDYETAAEVLKKIAATDATKLPRYKSAKSGEVFEHFISQKNLDGFTDKTIPVDTRMQMAADIPQYLGLFTLYAGAIKPGQTFDAETLELGGFVIRLELGAAMVAPDFMDAHPERKTDKTAQDGLKQMRDGYAATATGMIQFMLDHDNVRTSEATRFAGELKEYLPKLAAEFYPEAREQFKAQLKQAADKEQDAGLKQAIEDLLASIK